MLWPKCSCGCNRFNVEDRFLPVIVEEIDADKFFTTHTWNDMQVNPVKERFAICRNCKKEYKA